MNKIVVRDLGRREYIPVWEQMQTFSRERDTNATDEFWLVEHPPVFTLGRNGKREHVLDPGEIPLVHIDRGGQVTYHGPGQAVIYLLIDLRRRKLGVRELVKTIQQSVVAFLDAEGIDANADPEAPGVYVDDSKISALGLRVTRGCTYHGLSLNVDMDLSPFERINPCGYAGLQVTQLADCGIDTDWHTAANGVCNQLIEKLVYTDIHYQ